VTVRIGGEIKDYDIKDYSVVAAPYTLSGRKIGTVGVLGPTRMDYAKVISVVDFLTKNLSIALDRVILGRGDRRLPYLSLKREALPFGCRRAAGCFDDQLQRYPGHCQRGGRDSRPQGAGHHAC
jgi:hypothetical protein